MPVAHDANAAYSVSRSDAKAAPRNPPTLYGPARGLADYHGSPLGGYARAGKFCEHHTGTEQNATLGDMDKQGAGRSRPPGDARRQPPWPPEGEPGDSAFPGEPGFPGTTPFPANSAFPASAGFGENAALPPGGGPTGPLPGRVRRYAAPENGAQRAPGPSHGSSAPRVLGPGTGPQRLIGSGTGTHPVFPPGTGAQPVFSPRPGAVAPGTGVNRVLGPSTGPGRLTGSGPHPVLGSAGPVAPTPPAGFPAASEASTGPFSAWHAPADPVADPATAGTADGYSSDDTYIFDPQGAGAAAPPAQRRRGDRNGGGRNGGRSKRRFQPRIAWIAAAVVVAAAAGFGGYKYLYEARVNAPVPSALRLPTTAPGSNGLDKNLGPWQHIGSRSQDPQPLAIAALFPPQFELNGKSYTRTAASVTKTCSLAVYGPDLQAALQTGHCSQVVRASYLSGDHTMMGTIGVVNLTSSNAAQKAGKATGAEEIIAPLTSKKGPTSKLGNGAGVVQAEIKGHYLILMYAEYANLKPPSGTARRQALEQFATNIVTGSANINLSTRMLTGKP
jgi:hypothetical protein